MNEQFVPLPDASILYRLYFHAEYGTDCLLIMGRSAQGNDFILSNYSKIFQDVTKSSPLIENIIWLHGHGPSPHFILYYKPEIASDVKSNTTFINNFIKSKCPNKSDKSMELICCKIADVVKTDIPGMVNISHSNTLTKLLQR
jgi:hypothetical protein